MVRVALIAGVPQPAKDNAATTEEKARARRNHMLAEHGEVAAVSKVLLRDVSDRDHAVAPARPLLPHQLSTSSDTACRGSVKPSVAAPSATAALAGAPLNPPSFAAASICAYCGRVGAVGEPSVFHTS